VPRTFFSLKSKGGDMTDDKKKDKKDGQDAKRIDDEQLKDVAGGTGGTTTKYDITTHAGEK
jgi:hypothetical protein